MKLLKAIAVSFSMYSKIPMPQFPWEEEDMRYMLCFFPWVGGVIGFMVYLWVLFCRQMEVGLLCQTAVGAAIPLALTGGFHVDGFLDTMDAFHSYQPKERKLEILKDPHIGAFSVIMLGLYGLIYLAAFSEIRDLKLFKMVCTGFFLSRCLSGIGVVTLPSAKQEGLLYLFASRAEKRIVKGSLYLQGALCIGYLLWISPVKGGLMSVSALGSFLYYKNRCRKELGGINGDTAGYFVVLCEGCMVVLAAILQLFCQGETG